MALQPRVARLEGNSTAANVQLSDIRFENAAGNPDANFRTMTMRMTFNGQAYELEDRVTFPLISTSLQKQAAVRARLNAILAAFEPGNALINANIDIIGLPI